jgi:hypothetical protein
MLHEDPRMRQEFINRVAAPITNKLFEFGLIPWGTPRARYATTGGHHFELLRRRRFGVAPVRPAALPLAAAVTSGWTRITSDQR